MCFFGWRMGMMLQPVKSTQLALFGAVIAFLINMFLKPGFHYDISINISKREPSM